MNAVSLTTGFYYSSFPANALKNPIKLTVRSATFFMSKVAYFKIGILQFTLNQDKRMNNNTMISFIFDSA